MIRPAFILVAALAGSGLAAFAVAQESTDEQYLSFSDDPNWYLQRSTCTLAHSINGNSLEVVRFRIGMGVEIEFVDPALRSVRQGVTAEFDVAVDGASEWSLGMGIDEGNRRGYRLSLASDEILDRIAAGRRLEATTRGRTLLSLDLAGAEPAIRAMRDCHATMAGDGSTEDMNMSALNAMDERPGPLENGAEPEAMPNAM